MTHRLIAIRTGLDRPRLWRATTGLAGLLFCAALAGAAQGSITVIARHPAVSTQRVASSSWQRWCTVGQVRVDRVRLAFCARVEGIVVWSDRGPDPDEAHVAVVGGFHLTLVKLPDNSRVPSVGTRLVAIGPLFRSRNGQREVQAFRVQP